MLLSSTDVVDGGGEAFLHAPSCILELVKIVAHLLLPLQRGSQHPRFNLLLLLESARLAGLTRFFEELEAVSDGLFVHANALLQNVKRPRDNVKLTDDFLESQCKLLT